MTTIYNNFKNMLIKTLKEVGIDDKDPQIEVSKKGFESHLTTTVALSWAKSTHQKPLDLALKIKDSLKKNENVFYDIDIAGPGFINVTFDSVYLANIVTKITTEKDSYGQGQKKDYIINLEEVSVNPTGYLHVGHARNAVIGDSLVRLFKFGGYKTQTEYYVNDAGNQINILAVTVFVNYLNQVGMPTELPDDAYHGEGYDIVAEKIVKEYGEKFKYCTFENNKISDPEVHDIFRVKSTKYFLDIIKEQLKAMDVEIEYYNSELNVYADKAIDKLLDTYKKNGATYEKDGAIWLNTTKFGDDKDRVLVKSNGEYTYLTPDLASHSERIARSKANKLINVWGGDHHGYVARMRAGLEWLGNDSDILEILMIQIVRVIKDGQEFKMSKRKGTAVWLVDLLDIVGKDALRYMLASKTPSSHMDLDLDILEQKKFF